MATERSEVELLREILDTQQTINAHIHEPHLVMQVVAERSQQLTGASGAVVEVISGDDMVYEATSGSAVPTQGTRLARLGSLSGLCVAEGRPLRTDDTETDHRVNRDACRRAGIRSMIVVPLTLDSGETDGVLKVVAGRTGAFDQRDLTTLAMMARFIATALHHAADYQDRDRMATRDPLTGLANRTVLLDRITTALARSSRVDLPVTVVFLDLDRFKTINDRFGHREGDHALRSVAAALDGAIRTEDTLARLGGDEFVVVMERVEIGDVNIVLERIETCVTDAWRGPAGEILTASMGTARSVRHDMAESLLHRADEAMFAEKRRRAASV